MKNLIIASVVVAFATMIPLSSFAATYQYVDTNGNLSTVTADSAAQALTVGNLATHSGVMLVSDSLIFTNFVPAGTNTYAYVNTSGELSTVTADSAAQALTVGNLATHSGVMLITGM